MEHGYCPIPNSDNWKDELGMHITNFLHMSAMSSRQQTLNRKKLRKCMK